MLDLGLRGTELNLFAIIFGYSQKGDGLCFVTRKELARRCGVASTHTIYSALETLIKKGLVKRVEIVKDGQKLIGYKYDAKFAYPVQKLHTDNAKIAQGECAKIAHIENKYIEKQSEIVPPTPDVFIPPTSKVVAAYARSQGFIDPEGFAVHFCEYYAQSKWHLANGKPMKDWKKAVITWKPNNQYRRFTPSYTPATPKQFKTVDIDEIL